MTTFVVVERKVTPQRVATIPNARILLQVDFLVLHASPKPFDHDVVEASAAAVHADPNIRFLQAARELMTGVLTALVRVEDLRLALLQGKSASDL